MRDRWGKVKHKQRVHGNGEEWMKERGDKDGIMTREKQGDRVTKKDRKGAKEYVMKKENVFSEYLQNLQAKHS